MARAVPPSPSPAAAAWHRAVDQLGWPAAVFCALVVLAAGGTALALLAFPRDTFRYFSWTLRPPAAAAAIGGLYLASAVLFAWALTLPWRQVRPLFVAVLGLTVPTFVLTVVFDEVFAFSRWQAVVWVVLFAAAPPAAIAVLATAPDDPSGGPALPTWVRAALGLLALALAVTAVAIWLDASRDDLGRALPMGLIGLTGTYLGAWCSFLAAGTGFAAVRGRWDDAKLPVVALGLAAAGLALAFLRTLGDLQRPALALLVVAGLLALAVAMARTERADRAAAATR